MSVAMVSAVDAGTSIIGCRFLSANKVAEAFNPYRKRAGLPLLVPPESTDVNAPFDSGDSHADETRLSVYSFGIPIRELKDMFGYDPHNRPRFVADPGEAWLQPMENWTAVSDVKPGYYLLSVRGRFGNLDWQAQEQEINRSFGSRWRRASEHLVAESFFACCLHNDWGTSIDGFLWPEKDYFLHWGKATDSRGGRVWVGISRAGVQVGSTHPGERSSLLRVSLVRPVDRPIDT